jgi:hypothetical protein
LELGLASIEAQQRGHAGKKVCHAQVAAQYVWRVELDLAEGDAALFLADARRYEIIEDGRDLFAGVAVGGGPEGQERRAGRRREEQVGCEVVRATNTTTG